MDVRICANGHQVPQANLKACPACGVSLASAETVSVSDDAVSTGPMAAATPRPADEQLPTVPSAVSGLPVGLFFLVLGAVLGLVGWLAAAAADGQGMASGISIGLLWVSGVLTAIGVIAIGVRIGVEDARSPS